MKYYFQLQFLRFNRLLKESGFYPTLTYILLIAFFVVISHLTINSIEKGHWIYILLTIYLFSKIQNPTLASLVFSQNDLRKLSICEAILFSVPFSIILLVNHFFLEVIFLVLSVLVSSLFRLNTKFSFTIPTPFYKRPFEFIIGFRKTWAILFVCIGLCSIALTVKNYNLVVFSIALIYLNFSAFYSKSEHEFSVWIFAMSPQQFLLEKVKTALLFSLFPSILIAIVVYLMFPENWLATTTLLLLGSILPILGILNKYSYFPSHPELINSILIGFSLFFPPFVFFMVPYLINKATNNLRNYL